MKERQPSPRSSRLRQPSAIPSGFAAYERVCHGALLGLWLIAAPALCLIYLTTPPSPDQSQFDYMAWISTQGLPFYAGSFDVNWPGAMVLHEVGIRLFGVHPWTWRLTDFLLMQGFTVMGALFLRRADFRSAPFIFLALYPLLYVSSGGWMVGQRDIIASGFLLSACAMAMPGGRSESLMVLLCGALIACSVLVRPTYLVFLIGLIALEALPLVSPTPRSISRIYRVLLITIGFLALILSISLGGLALGNLDDWYHQTFLFSLSAYVGNSPNSLLGVFWNTIAGSWHWLSVFATLGLLLWLRRDGPSYPFILVLGIIATIVLSYVVQGKGFGYHLGGILLSLVILTSVSLDCLSRLRACSTGSWRGILTASLSIVVLVTLAGSAKKLSSKSENIALLLSEGMRLTNWGPETTEEEKARIVAIIREGSASGEYMVQYGRNYDIPFRAQRLPSFRFFTPGFERIPKDFELHDVWMQEVATGLEVNPPRFLLFDRSVLQGGELRAKDPTLPVLRRILDLARDGHDVVFMNDELLLMRRRNGV